MQRIPTLIAIVAKCAINCCLLTLDPLPVIYDFPYILVLASHERADALTAICSYASSKNICILLEK